MVSLLGLCACATPELLYATLIPRGELRALTLLDGAYARATLITHKARATMIRGALGVQFATPPAPSP